MKNQQWWPSLRLVGFRCSSVDLSNLETVYQFLKDIPERVGMKALGPPVVYHVTKDVHPDTGITGVTVITTSHITIHTFPLGQSEEYDVPEELQELTHTPFVAFELASCKKFLEENAITEFHRVFKPEILYKKMDHLIDSQSEVISFRNGKGKTSALTTEETSSI